MNHYVKYIQSKGLLKNQIEYLQSEIRYWSGLASSPVLSDSTKEIAKAETQAFIQELREILTCELEALDNDNPSG